MTTEVEYALMAEASYISTTSAASVGCAPRTVSLQWEQPAVFEIGARSAPYACFVLKRGRLGCKAQRSARPEIRIFLRPAMPESGNVTEMGYGE